MTPSLFYPCFLLPLYNHSSTLAMLVKTIEVYQAPCILIDDGSEQETATIATSLAAQYPWVERVRHEKTIGKGAAVKTGLNYAYWKQFTHAFQIDGDGRYNIKPFETV